MKKLISENKSTNKYVVKATTSSNISKDMERGYQAAKRFKSRHPKAYEVLGQ